MPTALSSGTWDLNFASDQLNGTVYAMASDGTSLYVGGDFTDAGGNLDADGIARWDGQQWHAMGTGILGTVNAIVIEGDDIYIGGTALRIPPENTAESGNLLKWTGTTWVSFTRPIYRRVYTLFWEGSDLYIGGQFFKLDENRHTSGIARWDGQRWHPLGEGIRGDVRSIVRYNGVLHAGGRFHDRSPNGDHSLVYWNGIQWLNAGPVNEQHGSEAYALAVYEGALCVGGISLTASPAKTRHSVLCWDGTSWDGILGSGEVYAMLTTSQRLYVAGRIHDEVEPVFDGVASWDGSTWEVHSAEGPHTGYAYALTSYQGAVYAGGDMHGWASLDRYIVRWEDQAWNALGRTGPFNVPPTELIAYKGDLIAGGAFTNAGGNPGADYLARWDGQQWHSMGEAARQPVTALATNGDALYVGFGRFHSSDLGPLVMWRDEVWSPAGGQRLNGRVSDIALNGDDIFVSGNLYVDDQASELMHWNGSVWRPLLPPQSQANLTVLHHSGTNLYAAGYFTHLDGDPTIRYMARWDGQHWHSMGLTTRYLDIRAITSYAKTVYIGGAFTDIDGVPNANSVAQWDGNRWHRLGAGLQRTHSNGPHVSELHMVDGHLFVAGNFHSAGQLPDANYLARWANGMWHSVDTGLSGPASSLAFDALSQTLHVGGTFTSTGRGDVAMGFLGSYASPPLGDTVPTTLTLSAPAPNPTREISRFTLSAAETQEVDVVAYDMLGRVQERIYSGRVFAATPYPIIIDTRGWASGTYLVRAQSARSATTRRITVLR